MSLIRAEDQLTETIEAVPDGKSKAILYAVPLGEIRRGKPIPAGAPRRSLGFAKRNAFGYWVSTTPIGIRYYSSPEQVGLDMLAFYGYRHGWKWGEKDVIRPAEMERLRNAGSEDQKRRIAEYQQRTGKRPATAPSVA